MAGKAWLARFCAGHEVPVQRRAAYTFGTTSHGARSALDLPFRTRGGVRLDD